MGNMRDVAASLCRQPDLSGVIRLVCTQMLFLNPGRGPRNNQGLERRAKTATVMNVGTREVQSQGDALTVDDEMPLGAQLAPVGRILARLIPPFTGAGTVTLSIVCHCQSMPLRSSYSCRHPPERGEDSGPSLLLEALVGGRSRAVLTGYHLLPATGPQDVQDAVEDLPMRYRWASSSGRPNMFGEEGFDVGPKLI